MQYDLTEQRKAYIEARGKTILTACPGSGKTTSVAYKLHTLMEESEALYGRHRGIACLSFTNKACMELEDKYKMMCGSNIQHPHLISTIDSFVTQNVLLPYYYLAGLKKRPVIVNDDDVIHQMYFPGGFASKQFSAEYQGMLWKYDPEKVDRGKGKYLYENKPCKPALEEYAKVVWSYRVGKGVLNSQDVTFLSCWILYKHPKVAESIAQRFPYIIVDEAQDTSELQTLFFDLLCQNGLKNMEYVGDVYQAIYEWRNANPENFQKMMAAGSGWNVLPLTENRRSVQRVIDIYSKIRLPGEEKIVSLVTEDKNIPVMVFKYDKTNINMVLKEFVDRCNNHGLQNCHILARGRDSLHKYFGKSEKMEYWKSKIPYMLIKALLLKDESHYPNAIRELLRVKAEFMFKGTEIEEKKKYVTDGLDDYHERAAMIRLLEELPPLSEGFAKWTTEAQKVLKKAFNLKTDVNFLPYSRKQGHNQAELNNEPVSTYYGVNASAKLPFSVETIHSAKGASYGGVLVFLSENSSGQKISFSELKRKRDGILTEKQRLLYVACSRAEQFLAFAVPAEISDAEIIKTLGIKQEQISKVGLQGTLF